MATIFVDGGTPPYQDEWYQFNESTLTYDLIEDPDDNDVNGFGTNDITTSFHLVITKL